MGWSVRAILGLVLVVCATSRLHAAPAAAAGPVWFTDYVQAAKEAKKLNRLMLTYFCSSDRDDWTMKLDKEVMTTPMFLTWAKENVVLLKIDFKDDSDPKAAKANKSVNKQNDEMRLKYSIVKVPTILFIEPDGEAIARTGYDSAKLRETEEKGQPKEWIEICKDIASHRPAPQELKSLPNLKALATDGIKRAKPLLIYMYDGRTDRQAQTDVLIANQRVIRYINANYAFARFAWPADYEDTKEANDLKDFIAKNKIGKAVTQFILCDPLNLRVRSRLIAYQTTTDLAAEQFVTKLERELPAIDYSSGWITDFALAKTIANQTNRDILLSFTSMDSSEWCQKLDKEIYQTEEFREYARKNLVLLKVDFPTESQQPDALMEQNALLAEKYAIRGYPTMVLVNPAEHKIGTAKYAPGGPVPFIKAMDDLRRQDVEKRTILSETFKEKPKK